MFKFNWYNKFGTIPSSYREAMSYEEQILWLCQQIETLKIESGNYNYNMLENKPSINGITLEGNINASQLGLDNYNYLLNKPAINGITLTGNKSLTDLGIQGKLTAGSGIRIVGNTISATGGGSGGTSDYRDLEYKPSINGITLIGDSTAKELKLQDLLEVDRSFDIYHTSNSGKIANIASYQINDIIPLDIPLANYDNACYLVFNVEKGSYFDIYGNYDLYKVDDGNQLQLTYSTNNEVEHGFFEALSGGYIIINFFDIGDYNGEIKEYLSGEGINQDFEDINKDLNSYKYDLDKFLENNFNYEGLLSNAQQGLFIGMSEDAPLPAPIEDSTSRYVKIATSLDYSSIFMVIGECSGSYMWFTTENRNGTEYLLTHSKMNIIASGGIAVDIPDEADYIYFQFTNFNGIFNILQGLKITEISGGASVNNITSSIVLLSDTTPSLESGFYALDSGIYVGSASPSNLVYSTGELIYYDATTKIFYGNLNSVALENGTWTVYQNENIENILTNSRNKIPTSQAVYNAIQNSSAFYTTLTETLTFNLDGTNNLNLTDGYYLTQLVDYYDNNGINTSSTLSYAFCYYNETDKRLALCGIQHNIYFYLTYIQYQDSTNGWYSVSRNFTNVLDNSKIATSISSSSDNSVVAGAKATYDLVMANGIPEIPSTTTTIDLTTLEAGLYHFNHTATIDCGNNVSFQVSTGRDNFLSLKQLSQTTKIYTIFNGVQTYYGSSTASSSSYNEFVITDIINKSIITASRLLTMNLQYSDTYTLIPLTYSNGKGSKFTVNSNGEIVIGTGVSKILIGGKCVITSHASGIKYFAIYKNGTKIYTAYKSIANNEANELICSNYVLDVLAGDIISLYVYGTANDNINGGDTINETITYLTLEDITH